MDSPLRSRSQSTPSAPPAAGEVESPPWVVKAWQQRGLIPSDKLARSREDLTSLHSQSWFVRRNRKSWRQGIDQEFNESAGWLARRNRNSKSRPSRRTTRDSATAHDLLQAWMKARLRGVRPQHAEPAASSATATSGTADSSLTCKALSSEADGSRPQAVVSSRPDIHLTLYDLCTCCNGMAHRLGIGVYHSGIELEGVEYTFDNVADTTSGSGIVAHEPYYMDVDRQRSLPLRCRIPLGTSRVSVRASHELLVGLSSLWHPHDYDLVERNCHHWCHDAACALGVEPPPPWVSRLTEILRFFSGMPSDRAANSLLSKTSHAVSGSKGAYNRGGPASAAARPTRAFQLLPSAQSCSKKAHRQVSTDDDDDDDDDLEEQRDSVRAPLLMR